MKESVNTRSENEFASTDERSKFLGMSGDVHKHVRRRNLILGAVLSAVILLLALFLSLGFFSVDDIIVEGSTRYDFDSIVKASGIEKDDLIFTVSEKNVKEKLVKEFAYVKDVVIIREYPSTLIIDIVEEEPQFYFTLSNEYFVIGSTLKVLDRFTELEKMQTFYGDLTPITLPSVKYAVVSQTVEFHELKKSKHVARALECLSECDFIDDISSIDLSLRFDMSVMFDDRIKIQFGGVTDFEDKLDFANGILKTYGQKAQGIIYVENIEKAYALIEEE